MGNGWCRWPVTNGGGSVDKTRYASLPAILWEPFPSIANNPPIFATRTYTGFNRILKVLQYPQDTAGGSWAQTNYPMPDNWDISKPVYGLVYWTTRDLSHGFNVDWHIDAASISDLEAIDQNSSPGNVTSDTDTASDLLFKATEITINIVSVTSIQPGDLLSINLYRGGDTSSGFADFINLRLRYSIL